ncbi:MAG: DUF1553 domain-containing protein [Planctomycetota bacterium]
MGRLVATLAFMLCAWEASPATAAEPVDFNRDIRPILSDKCFHCHGPDAENQESLLRFDSEENAFAHLGGYFAIVAGKLDQSELHVRIHSQDEYEVMPPPDSNRSLDAREVALLDAWILQGAPFDQHWSLKVPARPALPTIRGKDWPRNEVDYFVLRRLEEEGLKPSPEADPLTLLRRVTLDLTGLPPTREQVEAFQSDLEPHAYERAVDRLLESHHYGERMALPWLDAARYADSAGYQNDFKRSQWPWRDWVVRAYNDNMPFDQFTIEQLAGDLLEEPTDQQLLATAFNRNHRINNEGGIIPDEFLVEYVADRVETTGTVWLGLTVGCARCHDHKYDPISQRDFYSLFAFFHNVPEKGKDGDIAPAPNMPVYTSGTREQHDALVGEVKQLSQEQSVYTKQANQPLAEWLKTETEQRANAESKSTIPVPRLFFTFDARVNNTETSLGTLGNRARYLGPRRTSDLKDATHGSGVLLKQGGYLDLGRPAGKGGFDPSVPLTMAAWVQPGPDIAGAEGPIVSCMTEDDTAKGFQFSLVEQGNDRFQIVFRLHSDRKRKHSIEVASKPTFPAKEFRHVAVRYDGSRKARGVNLFLDGEAVDTEVRLDQFGQVFTIQESLLLGAENASSSKKTIRDELLANTLVDEVLFFNTALEDEQVAFLHSASSEDVLFSLAGRRPKAASDFLADRYFQNHDPKYRKLVQSTKRATSALKDYEETNITMVSIMRELKTPRDTYLLERGVYDAPNKSEKLVPATPRAVLPFTKRFSADRLGLARWLMDRQNPLTARVAVNRYWQMYFGTGIVKTVEDFGSQGAQPTHAALLDWLAVQFRESGWNVKAMQKLIVTSATYRQSSRLTEDLRERDPENRLLARGPRVRLYAQALRDQALAASGLLVDEPGGPPVMPYQPPGLWEEVSAKGFKYVQASGADLYRRSLYTFWRRTVPPPSMMNFDSANREVCSVNSTVTNTPLQAINLMNDPTYVEASRGLAQRMMEGAGSESLDARIRHGFALLLTREPSDKVLEILYRGYASYHDYFADNKEAASGLLSVGASEVPDGVNVTELAALTAVATVLLNLDESVTKE